MKLVARIKMSGLAKIYGELSDGFVYELTDEEVKAHPATMKYFISEKEFNDFFLNNRFNTLRDIIFRLVKIDRDTHEASFFCKDIEAGYWHYKYLMLARLMWRLRGQAESFCKAVAENDYTGNGNAFDYDAKNDSKIIYEEEK